MSSRNRPRSENKRKASSAQQVCVGCDADLSSSTFFVIRPRQGEDGSCKHSLCPMCFGQSQADRSADLRVKCQADTCNRVCREWFVVRFNGEEHKPALSQSISLPTQGIANKKKHPTQFFSNSSESYRKAHAILSISTSNPTDKRKTNTYVAVLNADCNGNDESNVNELERIGRTLHPDLIPSNDTSTKSHQTFANPQAASVEQLEASDKSPLRRLIHGISIGHQFFTNDKEKTNSNRTNPRTNTVTEIRRPQFQKEYNATYTATETIRTAKGGGYRSSMLKNLVSDKLTA